MAKRLISSLTKTIEWKSAAKAALAALALGFVGWAGFSFWAVILFFAVVFSVYFSESAERKSLRASFWVSVFSGLAAVRIILNSNGLPAPLFLWPLMAAFGGLTFLILGFSNFIFKNRSLAAELFDTSILLYFFLIMFAIGPGLSSASQLNPVFWLLAAWLGIGLIIREFFLMEGLPRRMANVISWSLALIGGEVALLAAFLPLGFINGAAFSTLFVILVRDAVLSRFKGLLSPSAVLRSLAIFIVMAGVIFATVNWFLP